MEKNYKRSVQEANKSQTWVFFPYSTNISLYGSFSHEFLKVKLQQCSVGLLEDNEPCLFF